MDTFILALSLLAKAIVADAAAQADPAEEMLLLYPEDVAFPETDVAPTTMEPDDSTLLGCPGFRRCVDGSVRQLEYMDPSCHYGCAEEAL